MVLTSWRRLGLLLVLILSAMFPRRAFAEFLNCFVVLEDGGDYSLGSDVPGSAANALDGAHAAGSELRSFSFTTSQNWVLITGDGFKSSDMNMPGAKELGDFQQNRWDTKCVAYSATGPWVILLGTNGF